ncbi:MAG: helix-turn-helix domain-containing protein [Bryobacteraceae bacterium]|nr:helix-turn-helix domain-containing protein [Bryobacteraceae bacterium]MCX7604380.1 helix-turn-helix domain-containing protein [Bryobacteraceae bacterium]
MSFSPGPGFERLLQRLIRRIVAHLTNGEYTERGLARLLGISQPHLHHILAGKRALTPHVADGILASLGWSLGELFTSDELGAMLLQRQSQSGFCGLIPVVEGRIGPNSPLPDFRRVARWIAANSAWIRGARRPFLVEMEPDPAFPFRFSGKDFAMVALDEGLRADISPQGWYVVQWGGAGLIRRLRREGNVLAVLGQEALMAASGPQEIPLEGRSLLAVVRARLLWAGPDPAQFDPFSHTGSAFPAAALF